MNIYPEEILDEDDDDGTMPNNVAQLAEAVVGHRIVNVSTGKVTSEWGYGWQETGTIITLDNGKQVELGNTDDCCAYTELQEFLLHPDAVNHVIMGVGTTEGYTTWHIYADMGDVLKLTVGWSCGNPFYYGYGFSIQVKDIESKED